MVQSDAVTPSEKQVRFCYYILYPEFQSSGVARCEMLKPEAVLTEKGQVGDGGCES